MIIKTNENTGQVKFICEFSHAEFVNAIELINHISQLIDSKTEELEELITENCRNIRLNMCVSFEEFSYLNYLMFEIIGLVNELNQVRLYIANNG